MDCGNYSLSERQHINSTPRPLCHRSHQATVMFATEKQVQTLQQSPGEDQSDGVLTFVPASIRLDGR